MTESSTKRGRPRSEDSREAILKAAFAVLRERGYEGMKIETVAEQAGVGKATIYRWWNNRPGLAVDAFFAATEVELRFPETGSVRENFRLQIRQLGELLRGPLGQGFVAMAGGARIEPAIGDAMRERWVVPRRRWGMEQLRRAVANGECRADLNVEAALSALYSPLYAPLFLGLGACSAEQVEAYIEVVLRGIFG